MYAFAVVNDANEFATPVGHVNFDTGGERVDAVLQ
jgi:hypothetical protein